MDKPLLFSGPLVKSIQTGMKTVTRRLNGLDFLNVRPDNYHPPTIDGAIAIFKATNERLTVHSRCPYGGPGDTLWVRENWFVGRGYNDLPARDIPNVLNVKRGYSADYLENCRPDWAGRVRPSIHMPKWFCRIFLEVTATGVERLHAITEASAKREGVTPGVLQMLKPETRYREAFRLTWIKLNGLESWDLNPWVWVVSFKLKNQKQ